MSWMSPPDAVGVWAHRRRPGASGGMPALINRSHGLEHTADHWRRAEASAGAIRLNWKYPLYHGGYRLWEVRQSLLHCDHALLLNDFDRDFAVNELLVPESLTSIMAYGIGRPFLGLPEPMEVPADEPLKLAVVGKWIDRKGRRVVIESARLLQSMGIGFVLTLFGTGSDEVQVRSDFAAEVRPRIRVVPQYRHSEFPEMLRGQHILLLCSFAEGYAMTLPQAMASGLAPIATRVGGAPRVITPGRDGELVNSGDAKSVAQIVARWSNDRSVLHAIRLRAQRTAQRHDWNDIAAQTIGIYELVLKRLAGDAAPTHEPSNTLLPRPGDLAAQWQTNAFALHLHRQSPRGAAALPGIDRAGQRASGGSGGGGMIRSTAPRLPQSVVSFRSCAICMVPGRGCAPIAMW